MATLQEVRQRVQDEAPRLTIDGDIDFVASEIEDETNAMIVGPSQRGPAFIPTTVRTPDQFEAIFGEAETYSAYSAQKVLERTDRVKFTRILSADGWDPTPIGLFGPAGTDFPHFETGLDPLLAILVLDDRYQRVTGADPALSEVVASEANQRPTGEDFVLRTFRPLQEPERVSREPSEKEKLLENLGADGERQKELIDEFRLSLNPRSGRYITKILPPDVRVYQNFPEAQRDIVTTASDTVFVTPVVFDESAITNPLSIDGFSTPRTPWIISNSLVADERLELFKFWIRSDSENENRRFKVSISNVGASRSESGWPTFDVTLRDFDDTDINQTVIEVFPNLSLNPDDERFIGRQIGTKVRDFDEDTGRIDTRGVYESQSLNIRVELGAGIERATRDVVPFGFSSYKRTFSDSSQVPIYRTEQSFGQLTDYLEAQRARTEPGRGVSFTEDLHLGLEFRSDQNDNIFLPIPENTQDMDEGFVMDSRPGNPEASAGLDPFESEVTNRKFTVGFQGGSEGQSPFREEFSGEDIEPGNTFGFDFSDEQSGGRIAYNRAFNILSEVEAGTEFNLLVTPELDFQNHNTTVRAAEQLVRERGDALYVFDLFELGTSPEQALGQILSIDSSYAATYYGWVREKETEFDFIPPSAVVPQTYVLSDNSAAPWFAPSGNIRGSVPNVNGVDFRLTQDQLDELYNRNVNSVAFFDDEGVLLWGNRTTLLNRDSLLSSLNVRRLLAFIVSGVRDISQDFVFEPNNGATAQRVRSRVSNLLSTVQSRSGVRDWRIEIDVPSGATEFQNRPNLFNMTVSIIPRTAAEFIDLDFTIEQERFVVNT